MTRIQTIARLGLFAAALLAGPAAAQQIAPISSTISASAGETAGVTVRNNDSRPMPIQVSVVRRQTSGGQETTAPADGDFLVFPPQAMIAPGASQVFRIQYKGPPVEGDEAKYFAVFTRVPLVVARGQEYSGVAVNVAYNTFLNVTP